MNSIIIIIDYFGEKIPEWFDFFLESCRWNPSIDWLIHTDCDIDSILPDNVKIEKMEWASYTKHISEKLNINFQTDSKYKICDIRPAFGVIWSEEIENYDFFGYSDIDVIYGDIRKFYTTDVLNNNNILSTHEWCFSGHLCLLRNSDWIVKAYTRVNNWKKLFEINENIRFDEDYFFRAFLRPNRFDNPKLHWLIWLFDRANPLNWKYRLRIYMKEQYTTPLVPSLWRNTEVKHSDLWFWKDGKITNDTNNREFIYLHFMNFKNARYMDVSYGVHAPWDKLSLIVNVEKDKIKNGFSIGLNGFCSLSKDEDVPVSQNRGDLNPNAVKYECDFS